MWQLPSAAGTPRRRSRGRGARREFQERKALMGLRESQAGKPGERKGEAGGQMGEQQGPKAQGVLPELSEVPSDDVSKVETVALAETLPRSFWASDPVRTASPGSILHMFLEFLPPIARQCSGYRGYSNGHTQEASRLLLRAGSSGREPDFQGKLRLASQRCARVTRPAGGLAGHWAHDLEHVAPVGRWGPWLPGAAGQNTERRAQVLVRTSQACGSPSCRIPGPIPAL